MEISVLLRNDDADHAVCRKPWICNGSILRWNVCNQRSIEVGDIQSFIQYIRNFTQPIQQIAQVTKFCSLSSSFRESI